MALSPPNCNTNPTLNLTLTFRDLDYHQNPLVSSVAVTFPPYFQKVVE